MLCFFFFSFLEIQMKWKATKRIEKIKRTENVKGEKQRKIKKMRKKETSGTQTKENKLMI